MWQDLRPNDKITLPKNPGQCLFSTRLENSWQSFLWVFESCVVLVRHTDKLQFDLSPLKIKTNQDITRPTDLVVVDAFGGDDFHHHGIGHIGAVSASRAPEGGLFHLSRYGANEPWTLTLSSDKALTWLRPDLPWRQDFILRSSPTSILGDSGDSFWLTRAQSLRTKGAAHALLHQFRLQAPNHLLYRRRKTSDPNTNPDLSHTLVLEGFKDHILDPEHLSDNYELWDIHPNFSHILVLKAKPSTKEAGKFLFFSLPPEALGESPNPKANASLIGTTFSPDWSWTRLGHILHSSFHTTFLLCTSRSQSWTPHRYWSEISNSSGGLKHTHETWRGTLLSFSRSTGEILSLHP